MIRLVSLRIRPLLLLLTLVFIGTSEARAQLDNSGEIIRSGIQDANLLMEQYLKPFGAGFGSNLNTGWVNTARPYRPFGFDLRINTAVALVPDSDRLFDLAALSLSEVEVLENRTETPTLFGEDQPGPLIGSTTTFINDDGQEQRLFEFHMPEGIGYPYVPTPMAQLTLGLIYNTDLAIRYIPQLQYDELRFSLWGLGVKHGLNQWIDGGESLPLDLSIQFGFTTMTTDANLDIQPPEDPETEIPPGYEPGSLRWAGQAVGLTSTSFTTNLLAGKTFPILSLFAGVGYHTSTFQIFSTGHFPLVELNTDEQGNPDPDKPMIISSIEEPLDLDLSGRGSLRALAGFRIRLGIITISVSYTHARYPAASVGAGLSFR